MSTTHDSENPTYQSTFAHLFEEDGSLKPFQLAKYAPKVTKLRRAGLASSDRILDVGVGYGAWLSLLEREGFTNLYGMDPFEGSIALAKGRTRAAVCLGRIEDDSWPFDPASFSAITCFEVVEHLVKPSVFFERARRYVKPNGLVLITTPLLELGYRLRRVPWLGIPDKNPTHINVRAPAYWLDLAQTAAFDVLDAWRGESLTHVRFMNHFGTIVRRLGVDHRSLSGLRQFEQSFCLLLRKPPDANA